MARPISVSSMMVWCAPHLRAAVDDYLAWCKRDGIKPEKSWHGKLTYLPGDELRHRLLIAASIANKSINEYMNDVLDKATREVVEG
jgi:predicted HicB family RNase H-like nuclease